MRDFLLANQKISTICYDMHPKKFILSVIVAAAGVSYSIAQSPIPNDTIWTYGYPLLKKPIMVFNGDGRLISFVGGGILYQHIYSSPGKSGFSDNTSLIVPSDLWGADYAYMQRVFGWDIRTSQEMILKTTAYNIIRDKEPRARTGDEKKFMRDYESYLSRQKLGVSTRNRKLYPR